MPNPRRYFLTSAQEVDPLSWFTGPYLPLSLSGLILVFGTIVTAATWNVSEHPWLQVAGLVLCVIAALLIHHRTRPLQPSIGWGTGILALATATLGTVLSALDYRATELNISLWWGPAGPALILVSLSPYLTARRIWVLGVSATIVTVGLSFAILYPVNDYQGPFTTLAIFSYPMALGTAAATVFSYSIVSTMIPMLESPSRLMVPGQTIRDADVEAAERDSLLRLSSRAAPFLERIAETGRVEPSDRALAGQLARRLRDDLVTQSSESWLDTIAETSRLVVVDPSRLARRMNAAQRTALLAMLRAVLDLPETDAGSLLIELRASPDGSTAVAVSMDMSLPEGRRIMHLAPYYLTLRTAVDDLVFDRERLTFRIPPT